MTENLIDSPLVSVIVNCFNGEEYLVNAIESVFRQTYTNWEIIFWDNQSDDSSAEIFRSFKDERLKYFRAPIHTKLYEGRNGAFAEVNGDLVAFLDVDDTWEPNKLELQVPLFSEERVGLVYGNYYISRNEASRTAVTFSDQLPEGAILNAMLEKYQVGLLTLLVRRDIALQLIGPFDPRFHIIGDFDFVIRMLCKTEARAVQEPIATYRVHQKSETSQNMWMSMGEYEIWLSEFALDSVVGSQPGFTKLINEIAIRRVVMLIRTGNTSDARGLLRNQPRSFRWLLLFLATFVPTKVMGRIRPIRR